MADAPRGDSGSFGRCHGRPLASPRETENPSLCGGVKMNTSMAESVSSAETHHPVEIERQGIFVHIGRGRLRLEYVLLAAMLSLGVMLTALFFILDLGTDDVERWGYAGLFLIVLFR